MSDFCDPVRAKTVVRVVHEAAHVDMAAVASVASKTVPYEAPRTDDVVDAGSTTWHVRVLGVAGHVLDVKLDKHSANADRRLHVAWGVVLPKLHCVGSAAASV